MCALGPALMVSSLSVLMSITPLLDTVKAPISVIKSIVPSADSSLIPCLSMVIVLPSTFMVMLVLPSKTILPSAFIAKVVCGGCSFVAPTLIECLFPALML